MPDGIVIDANIIPDFYRDYKEKKGAVYELVLWLANNIGIAINKYVSTEWKQVCSSDLFLSWYIDQLKLGHIRNIDSGEFPNNIKKKMVSIYGFPDRTADIHYVECAFYTDSTKYIITNNYDFYEPTCQRSSAKARFRAREKRQGALLVFLRKELGVKVGMVEHCKCDYGLA